jgi:hypothetical protein
MGVETLTEHRDGLVRAARLEQGVRQVRIPGGEGRIDPQRFPVFVQSGLALARGEQGVAEIRVHLGLAGAQGQGAAQRLHGLVDPAETFQGGAVVGPQGGIVRDDANGALVSVRGLLVAIRGPQRVRQAVQRLAVPRIQLQGTPRRRFTVLVAAFLLEHHRQVGPEGGHLRVVGDGLPDEPDSRIGLTRLFRDQTEQVQGVGVAWLGLQDATVDTLGLQQAAALMQFHRLGKHPLAVGGRYGARARLSAGGHVRVVGGRMPVGSSPR